MNRLRLPDEARAPGAAFPAITPGPVVLGAVLWTLSIAFFVGQLIAQAASARPYSIATNLISDLGVTACGPAVCSPLHGFMNATFVAVGLCHALGAAATCRAWPRPRIAALGLGALVVAGIGLIVAGLSPEDVNPAGHDVGALVGLASLNVAMLVLGWAILPATRSLARLTYGAGIVGLVGLALFLSGASGLPAGVVERIADYPGTAMVVFLGAYLLVATVSPSRIRRAAPRPGDAS